LILDLQSGLLPGDQVTGTSYTIFKVRIPNRDVQKGKSGGYRLIYYLQTKVDIILITIYSKSEQSDITAVQIRRIVREFEAS
jgi:mRNA-degrading endonuclease RelE of RelBE toxin-antitoxin system